MPVGGASEEASRAGLLTGIAALPLLLSARFFERTSADGSDTTAGDGRAAGHSSWEKKIKK